MFIKAFLCLRNHEGWDFSSNFITYPFITVYLIEQIFKYYVWM